MLAIGEEIIGFQVVHERFIRTQIIEEFYMSNFHYTLRQLRQGKIITVLQ